MAWGWLQEPEREQERVALWIVDTRTPTKARGTSTTAGRQDEKGKDGRRLWVEEGGRLERRVGGAGWLYGTTVWVDGSIWSTR